jgi:hypothetical protein
MFVDSIGIVAGLLLRVRCAHGRVAGKRYRTGAMENLGYRFLRFSITGN